MVVFDSTIVLNPPPAHHLITLPTYNLPVMALRTYAYPDSIPRLFPLRVSPYITNNSTSFTHNILTHKPRTTNIHWNPSQVGTHPDLVFCIRIIRLSTSSVINSWHKSNPSSTSGQPCQSSAISHRSITHTITLTSFTLKISLIDEVICVNQVPSLMVASLVGRNNKIRSGRG